MLTIAEDGSFEAEVVEESVASAEFVPELVGARSETAGKRRVIREARLVTVSVYRR